MTRSHHEAAAVLKMDPKELDLLITEAKQKLYEARSKRVKPGLDDKVLTSWNGLMLAAFAEAGRFLNRPDYTAIARKNAQFLYETVRTKEGRLYHTWKEGNEAKINGYLEDYAFLADGLLALYQTTFNEKWFSWAEELADQILAHFLDGEDGGFFDTSDDHEALIFRPKDTQDNALPSGNSAACYVLLQLSLFTGNRRYWDVAERAVSAMYDAFMQYPGGFGHWLNAASFLVGEQFEVAIIGDPGAEETLDLIDEVDERYRPNHIIAVGHRDSQIPLLNGRDQIDRRPTAYVCQQFACQIPTVEPQQLARQLQGLQSLTG